MPYYLQVNLTKLSQMKSSRFIGMVLFFFPFEVLK